jgi:hypothetical protein
VRTELACIREARRGDYVHRLLAAVARHCRLIVCAYGSLRSGVPTDPVGAILRELGLVPELELTAVAPEGGTIAENAALRAG